MDTITPLQPVKRYTADEVWAAEFEPLRREARRRNDEARTEAFLDVPLELCGEPVRQMTPLDMLRLDALGNPFIAGSEDAIQPVDCHAFIWELHVENTHTAGFFNLWRRGKFLHRLASWKVEDMALDISAYLDRMFLSPPRSSEQAPAVLRPESKTHFLAPLLANLCADMGHIDPASGRILAHVPMPRLIQYGKSIAEQKQPSSTTDDSLADRTRCVERMNELNWQFAQSHAS